MASKQIYVYENWSSDLPVFMGFLNIDNLRGKETCSFEYHSEWLKNNAARSFLDPDLQLYQGRAPQIAYWRKFMMISLRVIP